MKVSRIGTALPNQYIEALRQLIPDGQASDAMPPILLEKFTFDRRAENWY